MAGVISVLKVLAGIDIGEAAPCLDFDGDGKVGMKDALYRIRELSEQ
jgi:hypothetical protein